MLSSATSSMHPTAALLPSGSMTEALLDAAQSLIQQKGYNGFSYEDLSRAVGLKKPSIHHYFPRKEDLGAAVVRRYTEHFETALKRIKEESEHEEQCLKSYIGLFSETYGSTRKLCPCGILGAEVDTLPLAVAEEVGRFFRANLAWLTSIMAAGIANGLFFRSGANPEAIALVLLSTLEGAMVVGRGLADTETVEQVGTMALKNLLVE